MFVFDGFQPSVQEGFHLRSSLDELEALHFLDGGDGGPR